MNREIILRLFFILASAGLTFSSGAQCMTGAGVSGTSQICLGSTYSYNADYTSYCTWGCTSTVSYSFIVTGGTVTQSGYGFVRVKWTSVTGQIDLTVTDNVCWPDVLDQYGNPVCSNDCYTGSLGVTQEITEAYVYYSTAPSICEGDAITLSTTTGTGLTYQWKKNGSNISGTQFSYPISSAVLGDAGDYTVRITKNGCTIETAALTVTIRQKPATPTLSSKSIDPIPGASLLTSSNAVSPLWKRDGAVIAGAAATTYIALKPGTYTVVSTANNCSVASISSVNVTGNPNNFSVSNDITVPGITTETQVYDLLHSQMNFQQSVEYSDGTGRPSQSIQTQASPLTSGRKDMLGFQAYDALGRAPKSYLPFMTQQTSGLPLTSAQTVQATFYNTPPAKVINDSAPYADTEYEPSPMSRITKQGSVGVDWQLNNGASISYGTNSTGIRLWTISGGLPVSTSSYPAGVLSLTTVTNEQGVQSQTLTSRDGLKIVGRTKMDATNWAETYYVYDKFDRLRFMLPPELVRLLGTTGNPTQQQIDAWTYQTVYDNDSRAVETKGPGTGWVYAVYDKRDRVVLTQDGRQRIANEWSYSKYDAQNRPVVSGIYRPGIAISRNDMQLAVDALNGNSGYQNITSQSSVGPVQTDNIILSAYAGNNEYVVSQSIRLLPGFTFTAGVKGSSFHGSIAGGGAGVFPLTNDEPLVISYYDDYTSCNPCQQNALQFVTEAWNGGDPLSLGQKSTRTLGEKIASSVRILGTTTWLNTVSYYNKTGDVTQIIGGNHLGGQDRVSMLNDFSGKNVQEIQTSIGYNSGGISTIRKRYTYDHAGRLVKVYHQINSQNEVILSALEYNEIGQVVRKRLHSEDNGATFLQNLDFRYNIRGWMTNMNNLPAGEDPNDYYGVELAYNGSVPNAGNSPRKDGMVSALQWKQDLSQKRSLYNFTYDSLGQLKGSAFKANDPDAFPPAINWSAQVGFYNEDNISYDYNGNIKALNRKAGLFDQSAYNAQTIDQLQYDYSTSGGNQLGKVIDSAPATFKDKGFKDGTNSGDDYSYDTNGAVIFDKNKGIDSIKYYFNDRPKKVKFSNGFYLQYSYDAAGLKLKEEYFNAANQLQATKDYVGGIELVNGQVLQVMHDEGRITAPSLINFIDNDEAGSLSGFTALPDTASVSLGTAYINGQTYVTARCKQSAGTLGVFPIRTTKGDTFTPVRQGETYSFRVLGYQSAGTSASLYVKTDLGDLIWPGVTLPVGSANENWVTATITIPQNATSLQVGLKWSTAATNDKVFINRVALYKTSFEYNYFLTDQVGSPRVVLQTAPATMIHVATMETENYATENTKWLNLNSGRFTTPPFLPAANATPGGNQSIRMDNTYRVGPAKSFKVFPGDVVTGSVSAYFSNTSGWSGVGTSTMITAVTSVMSGGVVAIDGGIANAYNDPYSSPLIAMSGNGTSSVPNAYLNYILFDDQYKPIAGRSFPVLNLPNARHTIQFDQPVTVKQLGYLFVYLSFDDNSTQSVYFDDFKVVVEESPVIQVNNYYPFGMISSAWLREGEINNANLFQGKELIAQTGWHDFGSRMYYADLGRWFAGDPQKQFNSPYTAMGNMPMMGRDPNGEFAWFLPVIIGALTGGYAGASIHSGTWDITQWKSDWYKGAILGSVLGGTLGAALAPSLGATGMTVGGVGSAHTVGWSLTTTALNGGTVNAGISLATGGEAWQGALSGTASVFASQLFAAAGTSLLSKAEGLGSGFAKLGYQAFSTTATSAIGNLASGQNWDKSLNIGIGPFTLPFRDGALSANPLDHINNFLTFASNIDGLLATSRNLAHLKFDKSNLSWRYEDITGKEFKRILPNAKEPEDKPIWKKVSAKWGSSGGTIHGTMYTLNNPLPELLLHETVHVLFTRFSGGAYIDWIFGHLYPASTLTGVMAENISGVKHGR